MFSVPINIDPEKLKELAENNRKKKEKSKKEKGGSKK